MLHEATGISAFMAGLIDHAGLFPPRALSVDDTIAEYARLQQGPDAAMLSHCVLPVGELEKVSEGQLDLFTPDRPLRVAVLAAPIRGMGEDQFLASATETATLIRSFNERGGERVKADKVDFKIPGAAESYQSLTDPLLAAMRAFDAGTSVFFEPASADPAQVRFLAKSLILDVVPLLDVSQQDSFGLKFRCGHASDPRLFPTAAQIAAALSICWNNEVPIKFTAGLHHPVRHHRQINDAEAEIDSHVMMHGFLNVFGAAILLYAGKIGTDKLEEILSDTNASHFQFDESGFSWMDYHASVREITLARRRFAFGYGSCSFDEPLADLRELGLL